MPKGSRITNRNQYTIRLNPKYMQWIDDQPESRSDVLEGLVRGEMIRQEQQKTLTDILS